MLLFQNLISLIKCQLNVSFSSLPGNTFLKGKNNPFQQNVYRKAFLLKM